MEEEIKVPKDLGIKIGSKEEVFWTNVKRLTEMQLKQFEKEVVEKRMQLEDSERGVKFNKGIIEYCNQRIDEEKEKFKKETA